MSNSYQSFSYVYDKFMDNIPYHEWATYLTNLFHQHGIEHDTLIELGCGTGTMALCMADAGYSIIGIDNSTDMLTIAQDKLTTHSTIALTLQDMREFTLDGTYNGFYSVCDSLNYLLTPEDLSAAFLSVKKHLSPQGIFIFDLKTPYFYEYVLGDQTFCDHQEDCSYTWENSYFEEDHINQYDLTLFIKESGDTRFMRFTETHHQRAYSLPEIIDLLSLSGLEYVTAYDAFTPNAPTDTSERIYIIAKNRNGE